MKVSGHVFLRHGARGASWYAKYRVGDRQVKRKLGPAWRERGRPPSGYFTRKSAEAALREILADAQRGTSEVRPSGATFADAAAEWLRYTEHERAVKPSTLSSYRSLARTLCAELGPLALEDVTAERLEQSRSTWVARQAPSNRTIQAYTVALKSIFKRARRVWKLPTDPAGALELPRVRNATRIETYSPEEVWALVRAADTDEDAAAYLLAAFCGLRIGEILALRWREVDFVHRVVRVVANWTHGREVGPKSDRMRAVPLADPVAQALAQLSQRDRFAAGGDLVLSDHRGGYWNQEELRKRYRAAQDAAGLPRLRFHDLRHTFGTLAIARASPLQVKTWMGHADLETTERYLHYREQGGEADLLSAAFEPGMGPELRISRRH